MCVCVCGGCVWRGVCGGVCVCVWRVCVSEYRDLYILFFCFRIRSHRPC